MKLLIENWRKFLEEDLLEEGIDNLGLPSIINTKILERIPNTNAQTTFGKYFKELAPILHSPTMHRFAVATERAMQRGFELWARDTRPNPDEWDEAGQPDGDFNTHFHKWNVYRGKQYRGTAVIKRKLDDRVESKKFPGYVETYDKLVAEIKPDGYGYHGAGGLPVSRSKDGGDYWKFLRNYEKATRKLIKKFKPHDSQINSQDLNGDVKAKILEQFESEMTEIYLDIWKMITTGRGRRGATMDNAGIPKVPMFSLISYLNEHERNYTKLDEIFNRLEGSPEMWSEALDYIQMQEFKDYFEVKCEGPIELGQPCTVIKMPDDWFWFNRGTDSCPVHAREMANCGKTTLGDSTLLDLNRYKEGVDKKPKIAVGIEWNENNQMIYQILGKANTFPNRKYWPYIKLLYEFLGKPEIYDEVFANLISASIEDNEAGGMTPNQIKELEQELYKFLGAKTGKWGKLDHGIRNGIYDNQGEQPGQQIHVFWEELVPPNDQTRMYQPSMEYAFKIDFEKDPWPEDFRWDVAQWFGSDEDQPELFERLAHVKRLAYNLFNYHFGEGKYLGAKFYTENKVTTIVKRTMGGKKELVFLFKVKLKGPNGITFRYPADAMMLINNVKRLVRIPILKSEVGDPVKKDLIEKLKGVYPDSIPANSPEEEFYTEGKKIKISIIK
jgi:hypothetical protein